MATQSARSAELGYSRARSGRRADVGTQYFRSSWEANYARFLNWCIAQGQIKAWEYEVETFWFEGIKRGVLSYRPDFRVTRNDGTQYRVEIKGWMDAKSATKLKRMKKYHPGIEMVLVDRPAYLALERTIGCGLPHWEKYGRIPKTTRRRGVRKSAK